MGLTRSHRAENQRLGFGEGSARPRVGYGDCPAAYHTGLGLGYFDQVIFDPPPKSKRRMVARIFWPTLILVALVVAAVVSAAGEETRVQLAYLDEIRSQATDLARSGSSIGDIMSRVDEVDREEFTTVFESAAADLEGALEFVSDQPPTDPLIPVWALYRQAVQAWARGVDGLATAILQAADDPEDVAVVNATADALAELRSGDALFQDLRAEFERDEIPEPVSPPVTVRLSPTDSGLLSQSVSYVAAARRSTSGLGLRAGLRVSQVVSEPPWQVNVEDQAVIPATENVAFSAVITNAGNIASQPESLIMELKGDAEPVVSVMEVPALQPGGQTTIQFDPVAVLPETLYEVDVQLELSNPDSDLTDNQVRVQFTVNAP